jgi:hypothetical protein
MSIIDQSIDRPIDFLRKSNSVHVVCRQIVKNLNLAASKALWTSDDCYPAAIDWNWQLLKFINKLVRKKLHIFEFKSIDLNVNVVSTTFRLSCPLDMSPSSPSSICLKAVHKFLCVYSINKAQTTGYTIIDLSTYNIKSVLLNRRLEPTHLLRLCVSKCQLICWEKK